MATSKHPFKYIATSKGIAIYFSWLLFNIALLIAKKIPDLHFYSADFFSHTSNFVITGILMSVVSFIWILQGAPFKLVVWLGLVAITFNFIVELFIPILNTPDVLDAVYGTAAAVLTTLLMLVFQRVGTKETGE